MPDMNDHPPLRVGLGHRAYDIVLGAQILPKAGALIRSAFPAEAALRVIVVADRTVQGLHGPALAASLDSAAIPHAWIDVAPGEKSKSFASFETLMNALLARRPDRKTVIVAFGGGVIGDLAGFAASVLLRGVPFVQIPTSLLAQVDSSVGGKTGINAEAGKNLIGSFYQPRLVIGDTALLDTLPLRELRAGYAEIVKYGLLGDAEFFQWLERNGAALLAGDTAARLHAIRHSCAMKAQIVERDEREAGERALLNLGHTFGHAIEKEAGYDGRVLHGEAVAIGMLMAFALSEKLGLLPGDVLPRLEAHYRQAGLPTRMSDLGIEAFDPARLTAHCRQDKKAEGDRLTFILARAVGRTFIRRDVVEGDVAAIFQAFRA